MKVAYGATDHHTGIADAWELRRRDPSGEITSIGWGMTEREAKIAAHALNTSKRHLCGGCHRLVSRLVVSHVASQLVASKLGPTATVAAVCTRCVARSEKRIARSLAR